MTPFYFIAALIIQTILVGAEKDIDVAINETQILETVTNKIDDDIVVKDFRAAPLDWIDLAVGSSGSVYPTSSATMMAQAVLSDKSPEEQLEDIKEMATQITMAIQSEMANLLTYAIAGTETEADGKSRKKRSLESPTDSTQLVMRLLKHIKSNNDYQNIAIEKMMSAQEIADKYGIPFKADPEVLTDLAVAGNEQANELTSILKDVCEINNATNKHNECKPETAHNATLQHDDSTKKQPADSFAYYNYHAEPSFDYHCSPVTQRPSFYDTVYYKPPQDYYSYCSVEPMSTVFDEPLSEIVGEELEETITSKVLVNDDDEPGTSTVNHVTTYTVAEKTHFRKPHIEALPQQMQYYFYLM